MSREIKFRAWDKNSKSFVDFTNAKNGILFCQGEMFISNGWDGLGNPTFDSEFDYHKRDCVFMQYTGLKDKNGVEGWDHDIIMAPIGTCCGIVQWDDFYGAWWVYVDGTAFAPLADAIRIGGHFVGNVHQNPELLQK